MLVRAVLTPPLCPIVGTDLAPTGAASPPVRRRAPTRATRTRPGGNIDRPENAWPNARGRTST
jgi:hypothetical protein